MIPLAFPDFRNRPPEARLAASRPRSALGMAGLAAAWLGMATVPAAAITNEVAVAVGTALPNTGASVIRVLGALALVVGLFLGGIWLVRQGRRWTGRQGTTPDLRVLEVRSLGARQALVVVGYRRQRLLLSSTPGGITLIAALPDAGIEETIEEPAPARTAGVDFAEIFRDLLARRP